MIVQNVVLISQTVAEILRFFDFFKMAGIPHLGFVVYVWATHNKYLVVFITVQNLVGFDAV